MGLRDLFTGGGRDSGGVGDTVPCSCWSPQEADSRFGRDRPRSGPIYCDRCNKPAK
jgi:hypothetical protein